MIKFTENIGIATIVHFEMKSQYIQIDFKYKSFCKGVILVPAQLLSSILYRKLRCEFFCCQLTDILNTMYQFNLYARQFQIKPHSGKLKT